MTELIVNKSYLDQNLNSLDKNTLLSIFNSNSNNFNSKLKISKASSRNKLLRHF